MEDQMSKPLSVIVALVALWGTWGCNASPGAKVDEKPSEAKPSGPLSEEEAAKRKPLVVKNYSKEVSLQGVSFRVDSPNTEGENTVTITPTGLEHGEPYTEKVTGRVVDVKCDDLDVSGAPEVYVIVKGPEPDAKGSVVACAANGKKSMTPITFPADTPEIAKGYSGHDEYEAMEGTFVRRFTVYEDGKPTKKTRQVQYKLKPGEASWQLKVDKTIEY